MRASGSTATSSPRSLRTDSGLYGPRQRPGEAQPFVSVISIFFNAEDYFGEAIESVLAQDYDRFELLLCDDGSADRSTAIAEDFARRYPERVRVLHHPGRANRGMSATRNLGVGSARGDLIAFIDADDRWRASKLREQADILSRLPEA